MPLNEHYLEIHDRLLETIRDLQLLMTQAEETAESCEDHFVRLSVVEALAQVNATIKNLQIYQKDVCEGIVKIQENGELHFLGAGVIKALNHGHYLEVYDEANDAWCCGRLVVFSTPSKQPEYYFESNSFCNGKLMDGTRSRIRVC